jgi:outer membrane protein assembly factor BamB
MKSSLAFLVCLLLASITTRNAIAKDDWPQWRGVNRDGHSADTGLLKEWPAEGPKLVWKTTGIGEGYSGVSIVGDKIYTMGDLDGSSCLIVLSRAEGSKLWTTKVGKAGAVGGYGMNFSGPRCTPTVDGNLVFAVDQFGQVLCADATTGAEIWRKDYQKDFGGELPTWGFTGMPVVDGDNVIFPSGGKDGDLVALDKKTGNLVWRSKELTDNIHYSSPLLVEIGGVRQIVQLTGASLAGVRASDGKLLWRADRKGRTAMIPTPIYKDGEFYVATGYGIKCNLFKVTEKAGEFSVEQVYTNGDMINHHGGVILVGKYLYGFCDGKGWTCMDFETGKVAWRNKGVGKGSIVFADGLLYLRSEGGDGTVALIEPSPEGYKELGRFNPPDRSDKNSWPHPVVTGGRLYLRDQDALQCYDVKAK